MGVGPGNVNRIRSKSVAEPIPAHVRACDAQLHRVLERVVFSRHLNPTNAPEAQERFLGGAIARFEYVPVPDVEGVLAELEHALPDGDHPAATLVRKAVESVSGKPAPVR